MESSREMLTQGFSLGCETAFPLLFFHFIFCYTKRLCGYTLGEMEQVQNYRGNSYPPPQRELQHFLPLDSLELEPVLFPPQATKKRLTNKIKIKLFM